MKKGRGAALGKDACRDFNGRGGYSTRTAARDTRIMNFGSVTNRRRDVKTNRQDDTGTSVTG